MPREYLTASAEAGSVSWWSTARLGIQESGFDSQHQKKKIKMTTVEHGRMDGCQIRWAQHWAAASLNLSVYSIPELVGNSGATKYLDDVHSAGDGLWVIVLRE